MMLSWITVIRRETFPQRPSEFFDLVDWLRQLVLVSFFNAAPPCTTQLSSHDNLWRSRPGPGSDSSCRNQAVNFPSPPSPVKVEEDDEQPVEENYHLTPHLTPHLTSPHLTSTHLIPYTIHLARQDRVEVNQNFISDLNIKYSPDYLRTSCPRNKSILYLIFLDKCCIYRKLF